MLFVGPISQRNRTIARNNSSQNGVGEEEAIPMTTATTAVPGFKRPLTPFLRFSPVYLTHTCLLPVITLAAHALQDLQVATLLLALKLERSTTIDPPIIIYQRLAQSHPPPACLASPPVTGPRPRLH